MSRFQNGIHPMTIQTQFKANLGIKHKKILYSTEFYVQRQPTYTD